MVSLAGPTLIPEVTKITSAVILLHGYGADGNDLIGLAPLFARRFPNTAFFSPDGNEPCEVSPLGRQWFSLTQSDPHFERRDPDTQDQAFEAMYAMGNAASEPIQAYIDAIKAEHKLDNKDIALVGFSQGTMMALHLGLRQPDSFAALVGFSGALIGRSKLANDLTSPTQTLLVHGEQDDMLPIHAVELAQEGLTQAGMAPKVLKCDGLPHSIDHRGIKAAIEFLSDKIA